MCLRGDWNEWEVARFRVHFTGFLNSAKRASLFGTGLSTSRTCVGVSIPAVFRRGDRGAGLPSAVVGGSAKPSSLPGGVRRDEACGVTCMHEAGMRPIAYTGVEL